MRFLPMWKLTPPMMANAAVNVTINQMKLPSLVLWNSSAIRTVSSGDSVKSMKDMVFWSSCGKHVGREECTQAETLLLLRSQVAEAWRQSGTFAKAKANGYNTGFRYFFLRRLA